MNYVYLGNTGLKVSELCLGAMTFGRESSKRESQRILDRFVEAGGNFIDTANVYSKGKSESIIGRWHKERGREDLVIATKVRFAMGDQPNDIGLSRKHILQAVEDSLRRLRTDYIDIFQVHCWDPGTPLLETLTTLDSLVKAGKVRYIGVSNYSGWQLQKALDMSRQLNLEPFSSLQPLYNLLDRSTEWELLPVCLNEGLGVIPWSPLRGGWLTGKYRRGMEAPPEGSRVDSAEKEGWSEAWSVYNNERTWSVIDELLAVAEELEREPAQVALRWLIQRPAVTAPIIGARTIGQLESNLGAVGWSLSEEHMARLTAAGDTKKPYPYDFIEQAVGNR